MGNPEPHSEAWFEQLQEINPHQAAMTKLMGRVESALVDARSFSCRERKVIEVRVEAGSVHIEQLGVSALELSNCERANRKQSA